jgi:uncharacterized protein
MRYRSAVGFGTARIIDDPAEKRLALEQLMRHYGNEPFQWPDQALSRVAIIKVEIESLTGNNSWP